jgi:hypothetical protein
MFFILNRARLYVAGIDSVDRVFVTFGLIIKSDFSWSFLNNLLMQQLLKTITL